jgi:hypothetical protein
MNHPRISHPRVSNEEMQQRISRFSDLQQNGVPLMFIDSVLPGHQRMNYALIGDTASENAEFKPAIAAPHKFQIGMGFAPPGNGPAFHTHDYVESFLVLEGASTGATNLDWSKAKRSSGNGISSRYRPDCIEALRSAARPSAGSSRCSTRTRCTAAKTRTGTQKSNAKPPSTVSNPTAKARWSSPKITISCGSR